MFSKGVSGTAPFTSDTSQHPTQPCLMLIIKMLLFYYWIQTRFCQQGWGHPDRYNHRKSAARYYFIDENEWKLSSIFRNLWPERKDTLLGNQDEENDCGSPNEKWLLWPCHTRIRAHTYTDALCLCLWHHRNSKELWRSFEQA